MQKGKGRSQMVIRVAPVVVGFAPFSFFIFPNVGMIKNIENHISYFSRVSVHQHRGALDGSAAAVSRGGVERSHRRQGGGVSVHPGALFHREGRYGSTLATCGGFRKEPLLVNIFTVIIHSVRQLGILSIPREDVLSKDAV